MTRADDDARRECRLQYGGAEAEKQFEGVTAKLRIIQRRGRSAPLPQRTYAAETLLHFARRHIDAVGALFVIDDAAMVECREIIRPSLASSQFA